MKVCNNCGAKLEDNASFCNSCGSNSLSAQSAYQTAPQKTPVSVGGWIGRSLIPCIPVVGGIVYLIMLFIWSGDSTKEETFRNWAKAQLIVLAIVVVLVIICVVLFGNVFAEMLAYMN